MYPTTGLRANGGAWSDSPREEGEARERTGKLTREIENFPWERARNFWLTLETHGRTGNKL
jgi:hypothetical protein